MSLTNLQIFNKYARKTIMGAQAQNTALFNAGSKGTLQLIGGNAEGSFDDMAFFKRLTGVVRRRDAFGSGAVSPLTIESLLDTMVRVSAGTPPIDISPGQFDWINTAPEAIAAMVGKQIAEDTVLDMVNTAILGIKTALLNTAAASYTAGNAANLSLSVLNATAAKFGDRAQAIRAWLIHSKPMHDLYGAALTNGQNLFKSDTVNIVEDGFGRVFIVTDSPSLVNGGAYYTIGLVDGAAIVRQNNDFRSNTETTNGDENIASTFQAQWSWSLGIKGFAWDKANGGASPNDSAIGSAANWDIYAQSVKDVAGVIATTT